MSHRDRGGVTVKNRESRKPGGPTRRNCSQNSGVSQRVGINSFAVDANVRLHPYDSMRLCDWVLMAACSRAGRRLADRACECTRGELSPCHLSTFRTMCSILQHFPLCCSLC